MGDFSQAVEEAPVVHYEGIQKILNNKSRSHCIVNTTLIKAIHLLGLSPGLTGLEHTQ